MYRLPGLVFSSPASVCFLFVFPSASKNCSLAPRPTLQSLRSLVVSARCLGSRRSFLLLLLWRRSPLLSFPIKALNYPEIDDDRLLAHCSCTWPAVSRRAYEQTARLAPDARRRREGESLRLLPSLPAPDSECACKLTTRGVRASSLPLSAACA